MTEHADFISRTNFALARDRQVESRTPACKKPLYHIIRFESDAKLVTRESRLADDNFSGAYRELVADIDGVLAQALSRKILAESAHGECVTWQFRLPVFVVLNG